MIEIAGARHVETIRLVCLCLLCVYSSLFFHLYISLERRKKRMRLLMLLLVLCAVAWGGLVHWEASRAAEATVVLGMWCLSACLLLLKKGESSLCVCVCMCACVCVCVFV